MIISECLIIQLYHSFSVALVACQRCIMKLLKIPLSETNWCNGNTTFILTNWKNDIPVEYTFIEH